MHRVIPGNDGPPIMSDQHHGACTRGIDQPIYVGKQLFDGVVAHLRGRTRGPVTPQIRRPGQIALGGERRQLVTPGMGMLGETMKA